MELFPSKLLSFIQDSDTFLKPNKKHYTQTVICSFFFTTPFFWWKHPNRIPPTPSQASPANLSSLSSFGQKFRLPVTWRNWRRVREVAGPCFFLEVGGNETSGTHFFGIMFFFGVEVSLIFGIVQWMLCMLLMFWVGVSILMFALSNDKMVVYLVFTGNFLIGESFHIHVCFKHET